MALYVIRPPNPAPGADWVSAVPGEYLYNVTGVTARLDTSAALFAALHDSSGNNHDGTFHSDTPAFPALAAGLVAGNNATDWAPFGGNQLHAFATIPAPIISWAGNWAIEGWLRTPNINQAPGTLFESFDPTNHAAVIVQADNGLGGIITINRNNFTEITRTNNGTFPYDNNAHHVVVSYTAPTMSVFIDGAAVGFSVDSPHGPATVAPSACTIAGSPTNTAQSNLTTDEVAIYGHPLSGARAAAHFAAASVSFAAYSAAVLADTPAAYYHMDGTGGSRGRQVCLEVTDGLQTVALVPTGFAQLAAGGPWLYSWQPGVQSNEETPSAGTFTVSIPDLIIPAGYTLGTRTLDLDATDQWSNVAIWWDSNIMDAQAGLSAYLFPPPVHLVYHQEPH